MSKRILIIGNWHDPQHPLKEVLKAMKVEVEIAQNPIAAYPKLWRGGFDLIIADMDDEPEKQEEFLKVLWQAKKGSPRVEIIVLADFCGPDLANHAKELGVAFCLKKDTARDILEKALSSIGLEYLPAADPAATSG